MKKILLATVAAVALVGTASSSFAGGCGTSYVAPITHSYYAPTYIAHQPCYKQVVTYPVYQPCKVEKKVIVQQLCHTTYAKPCVQTYQVQHKPVYYTPQYHYKPACKYNYYKSTCGGY